MAQICSIVSRLLLILLRSNFSGFNAWISFVLSGFHARSVSLDFLVDLLISAVNKDDTYTFCHAEL